MDGKSPLSRISNANGKGSMGAIILNGFGPPEVLKWQEQGTPIPWPQEGQVLLQVLWCGVNRPDVLQRKGRYPPPPGASEVPGLEVFGEIIVAGANCSLKEGQRVCALIPGGGYAEYAVASELTCIAVPNSIEPQQAAGFMETTLTTYHNLVNLGKINKESRVLIHGASSGIGLSAVQLCRLFNCRQVFGTAGNAEKCKFVEERAGATKCFNYKTDDWVAQVKEETGGEGVDVILDMVAGSYVAQDVEACAVEGTIVFIATLGGDPASVPILQVMKKRLTLTGSTLRARSLEFKGDLVKQVERDVVPKWVSGDYMIHVYKEFSVRDAVEAHRLMETSQHIGKIVMKVIP